MRKEATAAQRREALRLYAAGVSAVECARVGGVCPRTLRKWAAAAGIARTHAQGLILRHGKRTRERVAALHLTVDLCPAAAARIVGVSRPTLVAWRRELSL